MAAPVAHCCSLYLSLPSCRLANDLADLLAPQSGAYYDVWLDGEKFYAHTMEVGLGRILP